MSRCGLRRDLALDRVAGVVGRAPSTKIELESPEPISGRPPTISATCPASFRHGQTTETPPRPSTPEAGAQRSSSIRPRCLNGQMFATKPFRKIVSSGTCFGSRIARGRRAPRSRRARAG